MDAKALASQVAGEATKPAGDSISIIIERALQPDSHPLPGNGMVDRQPISHQQCGYVEQGPAPFICEGCEYFGGPDDCHYPVEAPIAPQASCKYFEPAPPDMGGGEPVDDTRGLTSGPENPLG